MGLGRLRPLQCPLQIRASPTPPSPPPLRYCTDLSNRCVPFQLRRDREPTRRESVPRRKKITLVRAESHWFLFSSKEGCRKAIEGYVRLLSPTILESLPFLEGGKGVREDAGLGDARICRGHWSGRSLPSPNYEGVRLAGSSAPRAPPLEMAYLAPGALRSGLTNMRSSGPCASMHRGAGTSWARAAAALCGADGSSRHPSPWASRSTTLLGGSHLFIRISTRTILDSFRYLGWYSHHSRCSRA